ncbi:MAG: amino acid permease [Hyphomonadaceae bacterium]|nr:amino acid permease [Hyphomonadaceae bacterium]
MNQTASQQPKVLGFWSCWALCVGTMIGSGIFMLPAVLASFGLLSFGGWIIAASGSIALALVFARLAARTKRTGGPYVYAQETFGDLVGFLVAWAFWVSFWIAIPVVALASVGYLAVFVPALNGNMPAQVCAALGLIAVLTIINIKGLREASVVQIVMTLLKIIPLLVIVAFGFYTGEPANLPAFNPSGAPILASLAAAALITMWPFTGFEAATLPAGACADPEKTIPRALTIGVLTVAAIYLTATFAVMLLVPAETLTNSTSPFADAARGLGPWGPPFIAAGAIIATVGTLNGIIFACGQMAMAVALDKLAPSWLAATDKGGSPYVALLLSAGLGSVLLMMNFSRGLIGAFTFMLMMSTALGLFYYLLTALAELRHSWRSAKNWASVAILAIAYTLFAAFGSGPEVLLWGVALMLLGVPVFFLCRQRAAPAAVAATPPS